MNNMIVAGKAGKTIDSQELLAMVNEARSQCGEKEVRNNDFIARIKDELEGEHYEIFVVEKTNKTTSEKVVMSIKQALRVAARESKAVRRSLVDKLEEMQSPPMTDAELLLMTAQQLVNMERSQQQMQAQIDQQDKKIDQIATGAIPPGWQTVANLALSCGLTPDKTRQFIRVFGVPHKKIPFMAPTGILTSATVADEEAFNAAFAELKRTASRPLRGVLWQHPKMGKFQIRS
ncbi:anti-repressor [Klebsiella phage vB_KpnP_ZX1]|nr:anti-repressor [Klebsiella phage vB_KpnP_ZX1]